MPVNFFAWCANRTSALIHHEGSAPWRHEGGFTMSIDFVRPEVDELRPRISVIGVGGAGGNAVANMMRADVQGVDFIVANTDAQALNASTADRRIQLGLKITQGLGAGSRPEIGRAAAEETIDDIERALEGAHMCFIAAGMGGGTGTGAAPVIAKAARDRGIRSEEHTPELQSPFNIVCRLLLDKKKQE